MARHHIVIDQSGEMPRPQILKLKPWNFLSNRMDLMLKKSQRFEREELGGFAHGGTFYGVNVFLSMILRNLHRR